MLNKLNKIQKLFSVAGYESDLTDYIKNEVENYCDECYKDKLGNVICHKKGKGEKVLINIPVSSDGMFISAITDSCYGKFKMVGKKFLPESLVGAPVKDISGNICGIIFGEKGEIKDTDNLYIDFGIYNKDELKIKVGDVLEPCKEFYKINKNIFGMDIARCAVVNAIIEIIKEIKSDYDLYFAFSVMDNIGFKGAKTASYITNPDICIVCSSSYTDCDDSNVALNKGTVVRIKDSHIIVNKGLRDMLIKKLSDKEIPYQIEVLTKEGLINNEIMYLNNGILTANLNLCVKGYKKQIECINEDDLLNFRKSIEEILK